MEQVGMGSDQKQLAHSLLDVPAPSKSPVCWASRLGLVDVREGVAEFRIIDSRR